MENSQTPTRTQRPESVIRAILKEQECGNITVKEVCKTYGIHEATFYNWRKRYGAKAKKTGEFIEMDLGQLHAEPALFAEIELPGKLIIRIFQKVDPSYLKALR